MVKNYLLILFLIFGINISYSQSVSVSYPEVVVENQEFEITYTVNSSSIKTVSLSDISSDIKISNKTSPRQSRFSGNIEVNGKKISGVNSSFTYYATSGISEGEVKIPSLIVSVNGKNITSEQGFVTVLPKSSLEGREDFIAALELSSNTIFKGEEITAELKLYFSRDLNKIESQELGATNGLKITELKTNGYEENQGVYKGKLYNTAVIRRYKITGDSAGNYTIPALKVNAIIKVQIGGQGFYKKFENQRIPLTTESQSLQVMQLNGEIPENYLGVFSELRLQSVLPKTKVNSDQALNLKLILNGTGNFGTLTEPDLSVLGKSFNVFSPGVEDNFKMTNGKISGSKSFDYTLVPLDSGKVVSPEFYLHYFNSSFERFDSLKVESFEVDITPVNGTININTEVESENELIPIPVEGNENISAPYFNSKNIYLILLGIILAAFLSILGIKSINKVKAQKKLIKKKLTPIEEFRKTKLGLESKLKETVFHRDLIFAIEEYILDKYKLNRADFTKADLENILPQPLARNLNSLLTKLEFSEFSGSQSTKSDLNLEKLDLAHDIISEIEKLKK